MSYVVVSKIVGSAQNVTVVPRCCGLLALAQRPGHGVRVVLAPDPPVEVDLDVERAGQRVDHGDADAVQAAGDRVGIAVELAARVQDRHDHLDGGLLLHRVHVDRDAAAVVEDAHAAVVLEHHVDAGGVARHRLVDGVVHDLLDHVVQTALTGGADVHAGPLADRLEALENGDRRRAVAALLFRHGTCALLALTTSRTRHDRRRRSLLDRISRGRSGTCLHHTGAARQKCGKDTPEWLIGRRTRIWRSGDGGEGGQRALAPSRPDAGAPCIIRLAHRTPSTAPTRRSACARQWERRARRALVSRRCRGGRGRERCAGRGASSGRSARPP